MPYSREKSEKKHCKGGNFLLEGDLEFAERYYNNTGNITGVAYCKFLSGDIIGSKTQATAAKESDPAASWLLYLINLIEDREAHTTYFKVRNFYEQDLELLYRHNQKEIAEKIISKIKQIEKYNREVYKYTARVLINNKEYQKAEIMLKKSKDIFYRDPETHYMWGEIHYKTGEYEKAIKEYETANEVCGGYMPAEKKLKEIRNGL